MTAYRRTIYRVAGLCVLAALALQGVSVLAPRHDPASDCALGFLLLALVLQPDSPAGALPAPAAAGWLAVDAAAAVVSALPRLHPSRGPPA
jgi:hypothetical protein